MRTALTLLLSIFFLTSLAQIKITTEKNIDLRKFKTFNVQKGQVIYLADEKKMNERKIYDILKEVIAHELTMRGYQASEDSTAELNVSYVYEERNVTTEKNTGPLGQTPISDPANINNSNQWSTTVDTGTLILELEETKTKNSLWTATCTMSLLQGDFTKMLERTVGAAFRKFPVKPNKKK